ncbi:hypothetical protein B9G39_25960 [Zooshikella ganghwensis]|uniref:Intein C-terminal splicing domain-containing protein n=2 Tax=Zooshikella ganghwensis TaxID=202772 RepID=A0A4P9VHP5_9GAMM|nr:hypothetical protein B9G39_25960 [Zooshikella ganghwensis]
MCLNNLKRPDDSVLQQSPSTEATLTIKSIIQEVSPQTVYNFEVADYHTYFAGKLGAWVHNGDGLDCKTGQGSEKKKDEGSIDPNLPSVGDKLKQHKIQPGDAKKIEDQLKKSPNKDKFEKYIREGKYDDAEGYKDLLNDIKQKDKQESVLQALELADRIKKSDNTKKLAFERKPKQGEGKFDIDVAELNADGTIDKAYQVKTAENLNKSLKNANKAASQLENAPANEKIVEIKIKDGTWKEFAESGREETVKTNFKEKYPDTELRIEFSDGVKKQW